MPLYTRKNSLRLQGYDYSQSGAYFVTLLAYKRLHLFGSISSEGMMARSKLGEWVNTCWQQIPQHFPAVELDVFVVMPNHLHAIPLLHSNNEGTVSLSVVLNNFKAAVTRLARQDAASEAVDNPVWQRSFHNHIIRSEREYRYIAQYVASNPQRWSEDSLYS
jgi:REP element-mobilizing transposase RayT